MKHIYVGFIFLIFCIPSYANDDELITQTLQNYWGEYSKSNFSAVVDYIDPTDLEELQKEILPVFLNATKNSNSEVKEIVNAFFQGVPKENLQDMSPEEVFLGFFNLITALSPQAFEAIQGSSIAITDIHYGEENTATAYYDMHLSGLTANDSERFSKNQNKWYLRLKQSPKDFATKFQRILQ